MHFDETTLSNGQWIALNFDPECHDQENSNGSTTLKHGETSAV